MRLFILGFQNQLIRYLRTGNSLTINWYLNRENKPTRLKFLSMIPVAHRLILPQVIVLDVPAGGVLHQVGHVLLLRSASDLNSPVNLSKKNCWGQWSFFNRPRANSVLPRLGHNRWQVWTLCAFHCPVGYWKVSQYWDWANGLSRKHQKAFQFTPAPLSAEGQWSFLPFFKWGGA